MQESIVRQGRFNVYRPTTSFVPIIDGPPQLLLKTNYPSLLTLGLNRINDMSFQHFVQSDFPGLAGYTQLCDGFSENALKSQYTDGDELDNRVWANGNQNIEEEPSFFYDSPSVTLASHVNMSWSFKTYLRFKPDGDDNIFVTLRLVTWSVDAEADFNGTWSLLSGSSTSGPDDSNNNAFPKWSNVFYNQ